MLTKIGNAKFIVCFLLYRAFKVTMTDKDSVHFSLRSKAGEERKVYWDSGKWYTLRGSSGDPKQSYGMRDYHSLGGDQFGKVFIVLRSSERRLERFYFQEEEVRTYHEGKEKTKRKKLPPEW